MYWSGLFQSEPTSSTTTRREDETLQVMPELRDYSELCSETRQVGDGYKKKILPHEDSQALATLPRQLIHPRGLSIPIACPSLEVYQNHQDKALSNLAPSHSCPCLWEGAPETPEVPGNLNNPVIQIRHQCLCSLVTQPASPPLLRQHTSVYSSILILLGMALSSEEFSVTTGIGKQAKMSLYALCQNETFSAKPLDCKAP